MVSELVVVSSSDGDAAEAEDNRRSLGKQLQALLHKVVTAHHHHHCSCSCMYN